MSASGGAFELNGEVQLIGLELLRTAAEPGPLQFAADLTQARASSAAFVTRSAMSSAQLGRERHPVGYDMHPGHSR
jgi:hypothetical protein